jgi:hypothetical protein
MKDKLMRWFSTGVLTSIIGMMIYDAYQSSLDEDLAFGLFTLITHSLVAALCLVILFSLWSKTK